MKPLKLILGAIFIGLATWLLGTTIRYINLGEFDAILRMASIVAIIMACVFIAVVGVLFWICGLGRILTINVTTEKVITEEVEEDD
jgi:cytochrome b subunit of formate dehydrogenase